MSDITTSNPFNFQGGAIGLLAFALLAGGALVYAAKSHAHGHMGGQRGNMSGPLDPAAMDKHAERMVERFARRVDATPEQREKLTAIAKGVARDLAPLREQARNARRSGIELLKSPSVDRAALEQLRVAQLQLADATTRRVTQALADAAEVLTPEQRAKLAERFDKRMGHRRHG